MVQATETEQLSSYEDSTDISDGTDGFGSVRSCGLPALRRLAESDLLVGGSHINGGDYVLI